MRILPVIDLKDGLVVRGVGGRRSEYRAVKSLLAPQATPAAIASAFKDRFGLHELYVADLDAIAGGQPSWQVYEGLLDLAMEVWLDAGVVDLRRARELVSFVGGGRRLARVIVGLESLRSRAALSEMLAILGPEQLAVSIDLQAGRSLAADPGWRDQSPRQIAADALALGVRTLIVLDLAYVGEDRGPGVGALCSAIRRLDDSAELVSGGGVRGMDDLRSLAAAGCDAALVATALHDGRLTASDLQPYRPVEDPAGRV